MIGLTAWLGLAATLLPIAAAGTATASEAAAPAVRPSDQTALIRAADQALQGNRLVEAQALLDEIAEAPRDSNRNEIDLLRAELLIATERAAEALPLLAALDAPERDGCRASAARGLSMMQTSDLAVADEMLAARVDICGADPVFWRALGRIRLARARPAAAVEAFGNALALQPANDALRDDLAVALIAAGSPADAAPILAELSRRLPDRAETLINLDYANGMMGRTPARRDLDNDELWSKRLQYAGYGALTAGKAALGRALLGQAMIERPRYDAQLWQQYSDASEIR